MEYTFCSYNILSGCLDNYDQLPKQSDRFSKLKQGLKEINADFVGLIDTFRWATLFSDTKLEKEFGYKHNFLINLDDNRVNEDVGLVVMTNLEVTASDRIRAFNRDFIATTVKVEDKKINIYTIYLDDLSEDIRLHEISALLNKVEEPAIIHGDFNTFSSKDIPLFEDKEEEFVEKNPVLSHQLLPIINDMKRAKVIASLETAGYVDSFEKYSPTMPTSLFPAKSPGAFLRVDYIYHSPDIKTSSPKVYTEGVFDDISDHYPISTVLNG